MEIDHPLEKIRVKTLNYDLIWSEINKRELSQRKVAAAIGMSPSGFKSMMDNQTLTVKQLENLSEFLNVNPQNFFEKSDFQFLVSEPGAEYLSPRKKAIIIAKQIKFLAQELVILHEKNPEL